jgi:hypothetical protein
MQELARRGEGEASVLFSDIGKVWDWG